MLLVIEEVVDDGPDPGHRPLSRLAAGQVMAVIQVEGGIPLDLHHDPLLLLLKSKRQKEIEEKRREEKENLRRNSKIKSQKGH